MLCRHCGRKISLLRRLNDAEFCCDSHRTDFFELERAAALVRLTESGARVIPSEPSPSRKSNKKKVKSKDEIPAPLAGILHEPERKPKAKRQIFGQARMMGWTLMQELPQVAFGIQARRMEFAGGVPFASDVPLDAHPARPAHISQIAQAGATGLAENDPDSAPPPLAALAVAAALPPLRGTTAWRVNLAAWTSSSSVAAPAVAHLGLQVSLGAAWQALSPALTPPGPAPLRATVTSAAGPAEPGPVRQQHTAAAVPTLPSGGGTVLEPGLGTNQGEERPNGADVLARTGLAPLFQIETAACRAQGGWPPVAIRTLTPKRRLIGPRIRRSSFVAATLAVAGQTRLPAGRPAGPGRALALAPACSHVAAVIPGPDFAAWTNTRPVKSAPACLRPAPLQGLAEAHPANRNLSTAQPGTASAWPVGEPLRPRAGLRVEGEMAPPATRVRPVVFTQTAPAGVVSVSGEAAWQPPPQAESAPLPAEHPGGAPSAPEGPPLLDRQFPLFASRGIKPPNYAASTEPAGLGCLWAGQLGRPPLIKPLRLIPDHADGSGSRVSEIMPAEPNKPWLSIHLPSLPVASWRAAPADLKWITLALPAILLLALYSFLPSRTKNSVETASSGISQPTALSQRFETIRTAIMQRAAVKMADDFRAGLGAWQGAPGWAQSWTYTDASFVSPGALALYKPSLEMRDYVFAFLGQIDRRSLNWVVRARDGNNYVAMRIVLTKGGPVPAASLIRYAVINGKMERQTTLPLPVAFRDGTMQQIEVTVAGDTITTRIMGQVVDSFSEDRLAGGGVGFYSPKGDRSLLRWISITHQYDYIGRLCALLAPYHVSQDARRME